MSLPIFITQNKDLQLMQNSWASQLNPLLRNPITNPVILNGISLQSGDTVINHKLGQAPVGWFITDINGSADIYRSAPFNGLTLTLNSSAAVIVNIVVY